MPLTNFKLALLIYKLNFMKTKLKSLFVIITITTSIQLKAQYDYPGDWSPDMEGWGLAQPCIPTASPWHYGGDHVITGPLYTPNPYTASNFVHDIGTCNDFPFILKANNFQSVFVTQSGAIGINNQSPAAALDVSSPVPGSKSSFKIYGDLDGNVSSSVDMRLHYEAGHNFYINEGIPSANTNHFSILSGGDVGIGTPGGGAKLTVDASATSGNGINLITNNSGYAFAVHNSNGGIHAIWNDGRVAIGNTNSPDNAKLNINMNGSGQAINVYDANSANVNKVNFRVDNTGKTIIGHQTQVVPGNHTDALLTVNGKLVAKEIYVTAQNWADYVFDKNYNLPKLADVEAFYKSNHHLPDVPNTKEITNNGLCLGDMNFILL